MQNIAQMLAETLLLPYIVLLALYSRYRKNKIDIGIGPEPLINNIYHKKALKLYGYSVETFVISPYFITSEFDIDISKRFSTKTIFGKLGLFLTLINLAFRYKILYFYFNGGPLGLTSKLIWRIEPTLYKIAGVKTVVMPYGGDIQDMTRCTNLYFKQAVCNDYPQHRKKRVLISKKIDLWTNGATHIVGGCDWVDYLYAWDTLMLAHFCIDMERFKTSSKVVSDGTFKIFHAPNHKTIKGTSHLIQAVEELKNEGYDLELITLTDVPNSEIIRTIESVDIVADQFVIGWYAMFALEAMALSKPVICFLREDLVQLYTQTDLIKKDEIPIVNTDISHIKEKIAWLYNNRDELVKIGEKSRKYAQKHHSLESVGKIFHSINKKLIG